MSKHLLYYTDLVNRTLTRRLLFVLKQLASCLIVLIQAISPTQAAEVATRAAGMNLIIALIFFLLSLTTAQAATYWADPNGTSSNCAANRSDTDPNHSNPANYLSFGGRTAIPCMTGGDTLMLKPGQYWYDAGVWGDILAGTPSAYTTIKGTTGNYNDVVLSVKSWYAGVFENSIRHEYLEFADLTFDGSQRVKGTDWATFFWVGGAGMDWTSSVNLCLNDLDSADCPGEGGGYFAGNIRWRNTKIDGGIEPDAGVALDTNAQGMGVLGCRRCEFIGGEITRHIYGLYLAGERNIIDGVWIHDNLLYGVHVYNGHENHCQALGCTFQHWELAHHQIIRNSLFQRNGKQTNSQGLHGSPDMVIGSGAGTIAYNNIFDDGPIIPGVTPDGTDAVQIYSGCSNCEVYNNTFTRHKDAFTISPYAGPVQIANNLINITGSVIADYSEGTSSWTLNNNRTTSSACFVSVAGNNWQLNSGCAAMNSGVTLSSVNAQIDFDANHTSRPQGAAWDQGACEWFSGAVKCPSLIVETPVQPPPTGTLVVNSTNPASQVAAPTINPNGWTFCASENSPCNFSGTKEVRYGTNGVYVSQILTNGTSCNNNVFGDPVYGFVKQCEYRDITSEPSTVAAVPTAGWTFCASENSPCNFSGTKEVRYGTNGVYVSQIFTNGVSCNNNVFGDPVYGFVKQCEYRDASDLATVTTPTISPSQPFSFSLSNSGDKSVVAGSSVTNSITTALLSGKNTQGISFSVSGLPLGASGFFSLASCNPSCTTILSVNTTGSTLAGNFPITVTSTGGGVTKTTAFTLSVTLALTVAPPPITQSTGTGNVYYVAKTGSDSNSCAQAQSQSTPKLTINGGLSCLTSGDTLLIKAGTYAEFIDTWGAGSNLPSGTSWANPTTIAAYPANCSRGTLYGPGPSCDSVRIRPSQQTGGNIHPLGVKGPISYVIFDGLIFDGTNTDATHIARYDANSDDAAPHHTRIINSELLNSKCIAILASGTNHEWLHNNIHDNGGFLDPKWAPQGCHGFYVSSSNNLIDTNNIWAHTGWGVHIYAGSANNNVVRNNYVHDNEHVGILLGSGTGSVAYNNIIVGQKLGVQLDFGITNPLVYNNTIVGNVGCIGVGGNSNGAIIKNNICWQNQDNIVNSGSGTIQSNNLIGIDPKQ
jgi:parallel beta-helix repeat protein